MSQKNPLIDKAEDLVDQALRHGKYILPHAARLFIVGTFLEDGLRMYLQWSDQRDFMDKTWGIGWFFASYFVFINFVGQLVGCVMVLLRKYVQIACIDLFCIILLQSIAYSPLWNLKFFLKNLALMGGVLLLFVESKSENKSLMAGLPSTGVDMNRTYLQLGGRVLLVLMCLTLIKADLSITTILQNVVVFLLVTFIALGFKTKLSSTTLAFWLFCCNCYFNAWWNRPASSYQRDYQKYDFFQTLSVIGGLFLVVALGPGGYSVDEHKKKW